MPLYKVTLQVSLNKTLYIRAESPDSARITAVEIVLDDPLIHSMSYENIEEVEEVEEVDLDE